MKIRLLLSVLLCICFYANAQPLKFEWVNAFEYKGSMPDCNTKDMAVDYKNNLVTVGVFSEAIDFDPSPTSQYLLRVKELMGNDGFISKLDANGKFIWANHLSGSKGEYISNICIDSSNNIYVLGISGDSMKIFNGKDSFLFRAAPVNSFLLKMNENGELLWFKQFDTNCRANSMDIAPDGSIIVSGNYKLTSDFDLSSGKSELTSKGLDDIFIVKYDSSASLKWAKSIGGISKEYAQNIKIDPNGNILINGFFNRIVDFDPGVKTEFLTASDSEEVYIAKYDSSGSYIWAKHWAGELYSYAGTLSVDSRGNITTSRLFGDTVDLDPNSGIVTINGSGSSRNTYILKLHPDGTYFWHKHISNTGTFYISTVSVGINDNINFGGSLQHTAYLDFGKDTIKLESRWIIDGYYAILDSTGKYLWKTNLANDIHKIYAERNNSLYIRGDFNQKDDFDPSAAEFLFSPSGISWDAFCLKLSQTPLSIPKYNKENDLVVYPNPTHQYLCLNHPQNVQLFNMLGLKVFEGEKVKLIDLSNQASGMYILFITDENNSLIKSQKVIRL